MYGLLRVLIAGLHAAGSAQVPGGSTARYVRCRALTIFELSRLPVRSVRFALGIGFTIRCFNGLETSCSIF